MNITLCAVGKTKNTPFQELLDMYTKRLLWKLDIKEVKEANELAKVLPDKAFIVALDEHGKELASQEFATKIQDWQMQGQSHFAFVLGAHDGLPQDIRQKANFTLSLGKATWPHLFARAMLVEQLYRAQQILAGHPYHRE